MTAIKKIKLETNEEFIVRIMNWGCPTGALIQPFVISALEKYSEAVAQEAPEKYDSSFLSGAAWVATAKWLKEEIDAKYSK